MDSCVGFYEVCSVADMNIIMLLMNIMNLIIVLELGPFSFCGVTCCFQEMCFDSTSSASSKMKSFWDIFGTCSFSEARM